MCKKKCMEFSKYSVGFLKKKICLGVDGWGVCANVERDTNTNMCAGISVF